MKNDHLPLAVQAARLGLWRDSTIPRGQEGEALASAREKATDGLLRAPAQVRFTRSRSSCSRDVAIRELKTQIGLQVFMILELKKPLCCWGLGQMRASWIEYVAWFSA